jgi:hypothetical protein
MAGSQRQDRQSVGQNCGRNNRRQNRERVAVGNRQLLKQRDLRILQPPLTYSKHMPILCRFQFTAESNRAAKK